MTNAPVSIRLTAAERDYLALHGDTLGGALHVAITRLRALTDQTPPVTTQEAMALCGCLNGSWIMLTTGGRLYIQYELADYPRCNPTEAGQFAVDYEALSRRAGEWDRAQQAAVLLAVEAVFADEGDSLEDIVRRHFTITD